MVRSPFRPSFGATPPLLVGRDEVLEEFDEALDGGPGAYGRAGLVVGQRGVGKTVLLNAFEDCARRLGWLVISETARPGLEERLVTDHLPRLLSEFDPRQGGRRITGVSAGPVGVTAEVIEDHRFRPSLRSQMEKLTDLLAVGETGLLITVDEVHAGAESDLRALFATYQHAVRDDREVAIVAAGLPSAVSDLLDDDVLTFLRRAHRVELAGVDDDAVRRAVAEPIAGSGVELSGAALDIAVESIRGYPFLIQLVGHLLWKAA